MNGECFVFDNRISINSKLLKVNISNVMDVDLQLVKSRQIPVVYKGVSCPNCYKDKNDKQKKRYW